MFLCSAWTNVNLLYFFTFRAFETDLNGDGISKQLIRVCIWGVYLRRELVLDQSECYFPLASCSASFLQPLM